MIVDCILALCIVHSALHIAWLCVDRLGAWARARETDADLRVGVAVASILKLKLKRFEFNEKFHLGARLLLFLLVQRQERHVRDFGHFKTHFFSPNQTQNLYDPFCVC